MKNYLHFIREVRFILGSLCIFCFGFYSCKSTVDADTVYFNGKVYTVDSVFSVTQAFAVKDGKIIATGTNEEILKLNCISIKMTMCIYKSWINKFLF